MTATDTRTPDLLDLLAMNAAMSFTVPGEIRAAWLEAIQALNDESGTFDARRVRESLPESMRHGSEIGNVFRELSKSGAARMVGTTASGNVEHRADTTIIKVWTLTRQVWPEVRA